MKARQVGGSVVVTLPAELARAAGISPGSEVAITVDDGALTLRVDRLPGWTPPYEGIKRARLRAEGASLVLTWPHVYRELGYVEGVELGLRYVPGRGIRVVLPADLAQLGRSS